MQPFMKMKKKMGMTESTRQVLNRAIDLLHRLSNKKLPEDSARRELVTILSNHFAPEGGVEDQKKIKIQMVVEEANRVVTQLEKGEIPLYEAIMLVNRIVVSGASREESTPKETKIETMPSLTKQNLYEEDSDFVSQEFDVPGDQKEKSLQHPYSPKAEVKEVIAQEKEVAPDIAELLNRVLTNKKQLEASIVDLNGTLQEAGFELRSLWAISKRDS